MAARRIQTACGRCFAVLAVAAMCAALCHSISPGFVAPHHLVTSARASIASRTALGASVQDDTSVTPEEISVFSAFRFAVRALGGAVLTCAVLFGAGNAPGGTSALAPPHAVAATVAIEKKSGAPATPAVDRKSTDALFTKVAQKKSAELKAAKAAEAEAVKAADGAAKKLAAASDAVKKAEAETASLEKALSAPKISDKPGKVAALKAVQSKRAELLKEQSKAEIASGGASRKAAAAKKAAADFEKKVEDAKKEAKTRLERLATTKATFLKRVEDFKTQDAAAQTAVNTAKDKLKAAEKAKNVKDIKSAQADLENRESAKLSSAAKLKAAQATLDEQLLDEKDLNSVLGLRVSGGGGKQCFLGVFCS